MKRFAPSTVVLATLLTVVWWGARPAASELADVYLKSGLRLRGDVTMLTDVVVLRNEAGEVRLAPADVERVVPVAAPTTAPAAAPTSAPGGGRALPAAPPLSSLDERRLKLAELSQHGTPERVNVRFERKAGVSDVEQAVLAELRREPDFKPEWERILTRGQPEERLQLIVRETGLKYADRIDIRSDPPVFRQFRRQVLPLVTKSCARSGCHGGTEARVFRFPLGSGNSDSYVYASFVLLDQMEAQYGPLIDRSNAQRSILLSYLLPQEENSRPHPPVGKGPAFRGVVRDIHDEDYRAVVDWINYLLVPRPDYKLDYKNPYPGPFRLTLSPAAPPATQPDLPPEPPATSAPALGER